MSYKHLSIEERICIAYSLKENKSIRQIAKILGRSPSSISREIKRNTVKKLYNPSKADKESKKRKKNCGARMKLTEELKFEIIRRLEKKNSPEQICGRLKKEGKIKKLSFKTVYIWIYKGLLPKITKLNLRRKGKQKYSRDGRGKIGGKNICLRAKKVEKRREIGHWEGDTILGKDKKSRILTLVERKSRFVYILKLEGKVSESVEKRVLEIFKRLPIKVMKSITLDNGKEFSRHREIELKTGLKLYYTNPGSPHERGSNENTNGLLREYFSKGRDLSKISNEELSEVLLELNTRPRKCLNYNTPLEVFQLYL